MINESKVIEFINSPDRKLTYNSIGGVNGFKEINGEVLEFTLSEYEVSLIDANTPIAPFDTETHERNIAISKFRAERQKMIDELIVTISTGKSFDANEKSIQRLTTSVVSNLAKSDDHIIEWSTADVGTGVMVECTKAEIVEAHKLAVEYVEQVWSINRG